MRLDHVSYAAGPDGLDATAAGLAEQLGTRTITGGVHPTFGTQNRLIPLADQRYLEIVAALDHPAADQAPFGQAVRARTESGGGWLGWVVAVGDLTPYEQRLGRPRTQAHRVWPDGFKLTWEQIGVSGLMNDPPLPFFLHWTSAPEHHPSQAGPPAATLASLDIAGDPRFVSAWLGEPEDDPLGDVKVDWSAPDGQSGLRSVTFVTDAGEITL